MSNSQTLTSADESNRLIMESKPKKRAVHFEDLWSAIGGFGRYPVLIFIFMCYVTVVVDFQQFIQTYYGSAPNYDCEPWDPNRNNSVCSTNKKCGCTNCTYVFDTEFTSVVSEVNYSRVVSLICETLFSVGVVYHSLILLCSFVVNI